MLVNRDENQPHAVRVRFSDAKTSRDAAFEGPLTFTTFGSEQYVWINDGPNSHADPDGPPVSKTMNADQQTTFTLPKASITVLRGKAPGLTR